MESPFRIGGMAAVALLVLSPSAASAQLVDPACDTNQDGLVDDLPEEYNEAQQYGNLLNFYAVTMASSPLHAPGPRALWRLTTSLELSYVPSLGCSEQAVYGGYKTERTNKTPVFPRVRATVGLPYGTYLGISLLPPVPAFGVTSRTLGLELGYGHVFGGRLEVGARAGWLTGRIDGDLAGPLEWQEATDDTFVDTLLSGEGMAGYRLSWKKLELTPYLGVGYTHVKAGMTVGEDAVDIPGTNPSLERLLYRGPSGELGAEVQYRRVNAALEAFVVPLNIDPGNPRLFFSPRLRIGYDFF